MMAVEAVHTQETVAGHPEHHDMEPIRSLGFWVYLMSDLILFAALFATYVVLSRNFAGGPTGKDLFDLSFVLIETMLLLCSSAAYGLTMTAMPAGNVRQALVGLGLTLLLGLGFVSMELREFTQLISEGAGPRRSAFLSAFFTLVGTHGAHVTCGLVWLAVMLFQVSTKGLTAPVMGRITRLGMFWHFLDVVWIGVFSVVYLMGVW